MSNNKIKDWNELMKLQQNPELVAVLFKNNPIYDGLSKKEARHQVVDQLPKIANVDGEMITGADDDDDEEPGGGE